MTGSTNIKLGLDFDNTIVCYDAAIAILAEEIFDLPNDVPRTKNGLRDYLRETNREHEWTAFQGELYGPGMRYAQPFEGAIETMLKLVEAGHDLMIVSHRSRHPYAGKPHDLHSSAKRWVFEILQSKGLFRREGSVRFLETRDKKIELIGQMRFDAFIDDLPEVLNAPKFPVNTRKIMFKPDGSSSATRKEITISAWPDLYRYLNGVA